MKYAEYHLDPTKAAWSRQSYTRHRHHFQRVLKSNSFHQITQMEIVSMNHKKSKFFFFPFHRIYMVLCSIQCQCSHFFFELCVNERRSTYRSIPKCALCEMSSVDDITLKSSWKKKSKETLDNFKSVMVNPSLVWAAYRNILSSYHASS